MKKLSIYFLFLITSTVSFGQTVTGSVNGTNVVSTAVQFLTITPDARHAGMGEAGAASTADANAMFWNPGKMSFIESRYGASLSYTPWLPKITNDMWLSYLNGYYTIRKGQVVSSSIKYFDLGTFNARSADNDNLGLYKSREMSWDISYSRVLTKELGIGVTARYIYSNLAANAPMAGGSVEPVNSVSADIGVYYQKVLPGVLEKRLSLGAVVSNIGPKISYAGNSEKDFIPTNLKVGAGYSVDIDPFNTITFLLDFNKLLVPSPPVYKLDADGNVVVDQNGNPIIVSGQDPNVSMLSGMFGSFSDAPGGAKEEIKEFIVNTGLEYWYNNTFAGRVGLFSESKTKGDRKYATFGVGFKKNRFGFDVAYLAPLNGQENPLANTLRFSLNFSVNEK